MTITFDSKAFKVLMDRLETIESHIKAQSAYGKSKWLTEQEVMLLTGLKKTSLYHKRKEGLIRTSSVTGKKIKYLRSDVEAYVNGIKRAK